MSFISFNFVALFVCCLILYYAINKKYKKIVLLLSSFIFIGYYNLVFLLIAVAISLLTFLWGKGISQAKTERGSERRFIAGVCSLVLCWLSFRYVNNLADAIHFLFSFIHISWSVSAATVLFPLGISFYTFQAISYLTEVYWKEEKAENNLLDFLLYMLFFMKFLSGPIERPGSFLPQIKDEKEFDYPTVVYGLKLILIGLIKKLLIADQIAPSIDGIFNSMQDASGIQLIMACLLYPIQLYADFSGYTDIAIGGAMMFGLRLSPNFDRPFISQSTTDFWRRWHMSLSFWVRDYVYQPLTASTRRWRQVGIFFSLLVTFVALGVWHGAGWNFAIYGLIQGLIIIYEMKTIAYHTKLKSWLGKSAYGTLFIFRTYLLFAFSLLFFRIESIPDILYFIQHMSFQVDSSWKEINIGIPDHNMVIAGAAFLFILIYEYAMSKQDFLRKLEEKPLLVRWSIYYLTVLLIFVLGKFGVENFIYLQF